MAKEGTQPASGVQERGCFRHEFHACPLRPSRLLLEPADSRILQQLDQDDCWNLSAGPWKSALSLEFQPERGRRSHR